MKTSVPYSSLGEGKLHQVKVKSGKLVVVRAAGKVFSFGAKCPHYGAPLIKGAFDIDTLSIRCPWHGACFSVETGDIEDSPGLDCIHSFKTLVSPEKDEVVIEYTEDALVNWKRTPIGKMPVASLSEKVYLILGAGPAGAVCAETLRHEGFSGRILVVGAERMLPYDRTKLSKALSYKKEQLQLRSRHFYESLGIQFRTNTTGQELRVAERRLRLSDGKDIAFDKICIATGGRARLPSIPGASLGNIFTLRTIEDGEGIASQCKKLGNTARVVVIGSSFIGMEITSTLVSKVDCVTVVGMEPVPYERVLGTFVGRHVQKLAERKGVRFRLLCRVERFQGDEGKVARVVLDSGEEIEADVVVLGAGMVPNTQFIREDCPISIGKDKSILVDQFLAAVGKRGEPLGDVFAAGDVVTFPYGGTDRHIRVEHWGLSQTMGRVAARNMLGHGQPLESVPFFWTTAFGKNIRFAGVVEPRTEPRVVIQGDIGKFRFLAAYVCNDKVTAVCAVGKDPAASAIANQFAKAKAPLPLSDLGIGEACL